MPARLVAIALALAPTFAIAQEVSQPSADVLWMQEDMRGGVAEMLMQSAKQAARDYIGDTYGHDLNGPFITLAGDDAQRLEDAASASRQDRGLRAQGLFENRALPCGTKGRSRAVAFQDMMIICWDRPVSYSQAWADMKRVGYTRAVVHEYLHLLQNELAGVPIRGRFPSGDRVLGPHWLVEGTAEVIEGAWVAQTLGRSEMSLGRHIRRGRASQKTLSDLHAAVREQVDYDLSELAAFLLGERFGRQSYFAYFEALRSAQSHDEAFQQTYGMALDDFEAEFESLRENLVLAYNFSEGVE